MFPVSTASFLNGENQLQAVILARANFRSEAQSGRGENQPTQANLLAFVAPSGKTGSAVFMISTEFRHSVQSRPETSQGRSPAAGPAQELRSISHSHRLPIMFSFLFSTAL